MVKVTHARGMWGAIVLCKKVRKWSELCFAKISVGNRVEKEFELGRQGQVRDGCSSPAYRWGNGSAICQERSRTRSRLLGNGGGLIVNLGNVK